MEDKPRYRVYFAIAAICALLRDDLSERSIETAEELKRTYTFLGRARASLENDPERYHDAFLLTFQAVADSVLEIPTGKSEGDISQNMYSRISTTAFSSLHRKILMRMDSERRRESRSRIRDASTGR
jgi:hypothetical protein